MHKPNTNTSHRTLGLKQYELSNHLGNVLSVISDIKLPVLAEDGTTIISYSAVVISATDYSAFGVALYGRTWSSDSYRYGFNGKEKDNEGMGGGNQTYDYGFRIYNPSLGKFLSVDPLHSCYPWYTPYQFAGNKPIWAIDIDGMEEFYVNIVMNEDKSKTVTVVRNYDIQGTFKGSSGTAVNCPGTGEVIRGPHAEKFQISVNGVVVALTDTYKREESAWVNEVVMMAEASTAAMRIAECTFQHRAIKNIPVPKPPVTEEKKEIKSTVPPKPTKIKKPTPTPTPIPTPMPDPIPVTIALNIGVSFDGDQAEFDSPTDSRWGSDHLDKDLAETISILRKDPRNFVSITVGTSLDMDASHPTYGTVANLLEARKQAVIAEFRRIAPDISPDRIRIVKADHCGIGFKGTVTQHK